MKKILLTLSTVAIMASCNQKQAESVPALDRANFDESVALNEDFYQYATGGWQAKNPLKPSLRATAHLTCCARTTRFV